MAQAVSRALATRKPRFDRRSVRVRIVVGKVALAQVFLRQYHVHLRACCCYSRTNGRSLVANNEVLRLQWIEKQFRVACPPVVSELQDFYVALSTCWLTAGIMRLWSECSHCQLCDSVKVCRRNPTLCYVSLRSVCAAARLSVCLSVQPLAR